MTTELANSVGKKSAAFLLFEESTQASKKKRGWLDIIELILSQCLEGLVKTRIMYACNLNSKQVNQYLDFLVECGFLEARKEVVYVTARYYTTDLGKTFMQKYDQLREILDVGASHASTTS
jgi:predicted transcriptional regulator